ncbi:hypothetical protein [Spirosoma sordidisoli]|uniref:Uncharacterized protein n=1 Tax=Spirosoma sordidisoli TaxID=2502893 RepID=A0A4Q2UC79_9BACT|nr:hypothetical protein [Spirosoma sordidisoli]RYC66366.1 hypothetical protein EQG79_30295 [Spirosoma sordidisoli]
MNQLHMITGRLNRYVLSAADKAEIRSIMADLRAEAIALTLRGETLPPTNPGLARLKSLIVDEGLLDELQTAACAVRVEAITAVQRGQISATDPAGIAAMNRFNHLGK